MKFDTHGLRIGTRIRHTRVVPNGNPNVKHREGEVVDVSRHIFAVRFNGKQYIEWFPYTLLECNEREWVRIVKG